MSLYLPFIPKHLISTYLQHTYTLIQKTNKHTIPISIYILTILFYHYFIPSSFHPYPIFYSIHLLSYLSIPILSSLPTPSITHNSTIFYSQFTLSPFYYHTIYHSIPSKIRRRRYISIHPISIIHSKYNYRIISIILLLNYYTIELYYSILFYLFSFIYYTYLYSYSYYIHHVLTIPPLYPILLYTHRHIDRHTQIHIDRHIVKFNSL